ncbi:hypothetical protein DL770_008614 [Monosporascus sp. CRB-9-2]|nr:hypothetical protein DL770_008614 [Monosporascus sp. CRB-9-2]
MGKSFKAIPTGLFIGNEFVPATQGETLDLENPATGSFLATVSAAQPADVDKAVASSKAAFQEWRKVAPAQRRALLNRLGDLIERDGPELATIEAVDAGVLYGLSLGKSVALAAETCRYFAGWADKIQGKTINIEDGLAYTKQEPIGVCAAIVPWNMPLMITMWKLAPAIACGNTLIVKTPEIAPLFGQKLGQLVTEAGFPPGVINIICGLGKVAGQRLAEHNDVRKLSFTGSAVVGRTIMAIAAKTNLKKVTLELGGKGPSIVFADADWNNAIFWTTAGITVHNGQICAAGSRIYVQDEIYDKFVEEFSARSRESVVGDPLLNTTTKGPLASGLQKERVVEYVKKGQDECLQVLHSDRADSMPGQGYFVPNVVFCNVRPTSSLIRDEIFGPVATISRFKTEEEAIALANNSEYGLAASVFTSRVDRAMRVSDAVEAGVITINMWGTVNANTPFGGIKQSGFGRDCGEEAIDEWTETKCVQFNMTPLP